MLGWPEICSDEALKPITTEGMSCLAKTIVFFGVPGWLIHQFSNQKCWEIYIGNIQVYVA